MKTAFIYTKNYIQYDYGSSHPLKIERLQLTYDLCRAYDLFSSPEKSLIETKPASEDDPLASLELTTNGFCKVIAYLIKQELPWVALGGGGYKPSNVARAWTLAWAIMNRLDLPDDLPESIVKTLSRRGFSGQKLRDPEHHSLQREKCRQRMQECVEYIQLKIFPKIQ